MEPIVSALLVLGSLTEWKPRAKRKRMKSAVYLSSGSNPNEMFRWRRRPEREKRVQCYRQKNWYIRVLGIKREKV